MKNIIRSFIYFIFFTLLSGINFSAPAICETTPTEKISVQMAKHYYLPTSQIEEIFKNNIHLDDNQIIYTTVPRGLVISINSNFFYNNGKDEILDSSKPLLLKISTILKEINNECIIEANTTDTDLEQNNYDSQWELSLVQADTIADFMIKTGKVPPQKLRANGFGNILPFYDYKKHQTDMQKRIDFVIINYEKTKIIN